MVSPVVVDRDVIVGNGADKDPVLTTVDLALQVLHAVSESVDLLLQFVQSVVVVAHDWFLSAESVGNRVRDDLGPHNTESIDG